MVTYPAKDLQIHYEIQIRFIKYTEENILLEINKKQVYINNEAPDIKVYEMASEMANSFYPIQFHVDNKGIITHIENHDDIVIRCKQTELNLQQNYKEEIAKKIIRNFNTDYTNPNNIMLALQEDIFLQLYFFPLHTTYDLLQPEKTAFTFKYDVNKKPVNILLKRTLGDTYTASGKIPVQINNADKADEEYNRWDILYKLHPNDHSIFSINASICINDGKYDPQEMIFEVNHLEEKDMVNKDADEINEKQKPERVSVFVDEDVPKQKTGFWNKIF